MEQNSKILVLGGSGMVGSALKRVFPDADTPIRSQIDLGSWGRTAYYFDRFQPEYVFMAAGEVGGIQANIDAPADFLIDNALMAAHVVKACHVYEVKKLLYLGSSCMYPAQCPQPMKPSDLLSGPFEPTNEGYALAKTVGVTLCRLYRKQFGSNFISAIPCNLYGPRDHYDPTNSHVMAALIRKFVTAKVGESVTVWGSGEPFREFLHVDDLAAACVHLMQNYNEAEPVNVGASQDISIRELAELIAKKAGFTGEIIFDTSKPDGVHSKLMESSRMRGMGWAPRISLEEGIERTILDFKRENGI